MEIKMGDVFYVIESTQGKNYTTTCRICDGKKELTVRGFTFKCPACEKEEKVLYVVGYVVRRYRVYSIKEEMPCDEWKASDRRYKKYGLYSKHGKGYYSSNYKQISKSEYEMTRDINKNKINHRNYGDFVFSDYKFAVECADELTQQSIDMVREYNKQHGTNYDLPAFDIVHDKKSK